MRDARRGRSGGGAARVGRLLELNERLRDYLPSVTDRANALQVTRETVATWDRRNVERVRSANIDRLETVLSVCEAARRYLPTGQLVGVWLESPQTFLYGLTPLEYLHEGGEADFLVASIPPPVATIGKRGAAIYKKVRPRLEGVVDPARRKKSG